ncbi:hypothetical protein L2E82_40270 [Cichorium intybus]|uniref:Uncharacterized protein n=1 Tax=Cichorium intybus TaxID=13427 RepID=A0ACB9AKX0_CICIN|nr:hypothetical protein L2E82_40270 [Cichorium intybus]
MRFFILLEIQEGIFFVYVISEVYNNINVIKNVYCGLVVSPAHQARLVIEPTSSNSLLLDIEPKSLYEEHRLSLLIVFLLPRHQLQPSGIRIKIIREQASKH